MEQSKEEKVHRVFENIYQQYDKMNSIISFRQHIRWRKDTMKQMNVQKGKKALDVCCGTADWTIAMSKAIGENGEVIGLDFSENMLKVGREKLVKEHIHNAKLVQGNAMELPFPDNSFEYVTIGFGLRNVPDYMQVLREMYRVLKPGESLPALKLPNRQCSVSDKYIIFIFITLCRYSGSCLPKAIKSIRGCKNRQERFRMRKNWRRCLKRRDLIM